MEGYIYNDNRGDENIIEEDIEKIISQNDSILYDVINQFDLDGIKFNPYTKNFIVKLNNNLNLKFFQDELTVKYIGKGVTTDFASAQSNFPMSNENAGFYFEICIEEIGSKSKIAIGLSDKDFIIGNQVGAISKTFGYSCEGKIYQEKPLGEKYGQEYKKNDIVGCGFYFRKSMVFYTLNGKYLGPAFYLQEYYDLFPTVSLKAFNEQVKFNFGKTPFMFDVENFFVNQFKELAPKIFSYKSSISEVDYLIREYMIHSGYSNTFKILDSENANDHVQRKKSQENEALLNYLKKERKESEDLAFRKMSEDLEKVEGKPEDFKDRGLSILLGRKLSEDKTTNHQDKRKNINNLDDIDNLRRPDVYKIMTFLGERNSNFLIKKFHHLLKKKTMKKLNAFLKITLRSLVHLCYSIKYC